MTRANEPRLKRERFAERRFNILEVHQRERSKSQILDHLDLVRAIPHIQSVNKRIPKTEAHRTDAKQKRRSRDTLEDLKELIRELRVENGATDDEIADELPLTAARDSGS